MDETINIGDTVVVSAGTTVFGKNRRGPGPTEALQTYSVVVAEVHDGMVSWVGGDRRKRSALIPDVWKIDPEPADGRRTCKGCRRELPISDFYGRQLRDVSRALALCKLCCKASYAEKHASGNRAGWRLRKYGLSPDEYEQLHRSQAGRCAICQLPENLNRDGRALNVDHCHTTGQIRGLLCTSCNLALGYIGDSAHHARQLAAYLEHHEGEACDLDDRHA